MSKEKVRGRPKKEIPVYICEVCGESHIEQPYKTDLSRNIERANWHFSFNPKIKTCKKCSDSLLDHLHKWYDKNNKTNTLSKFKGEIKINNMEDGAKYIFSKVNTDG